MENLKGTLESLYAKETANGSGLQNNKVANFAYTDTAYQNDDAEGVTAYQQEREQNIPVNQPAVLDVNATVLAKGYRSQASSLTRMLMNHFFGRTSYNLNKIHDWFTLLVGQLRQYIKGCVNAWSEDVTYSQGEYCFVYTTLGAGGVPFISIYRSLADNNQNHDPSVPAYSDYWKLISIKDDTSKQNVKAWVSGRRYELGEIVYVGDDNSTLSFYKCLEDGTAETPAPNAAKWLLQSVSYSTNASVMVGEGRVPYAKGNKTLPVYFVGGIPMECEVPALTYPAGNKRWMVFDFKDGNRKSIKIKKGVRLVLEILKPDRSIEKRVFETSADTSFDFSAQMQTAADNASSRTGQINGRDFYIYLVPEGATGTKLVVSLNSTFPNDVDASYTADNTRKIGQFHTLCENANYTQGTMLTMIMESNATAGNKVLVKNYKPDADGFYDFYNKEVRSKTGTIVTVEHPLNNFLAGQILPESVWCLTWRPEGCDPSGMTYDKNTNLAVDIYLQTGSCNTTASIFGGTITGTRSQSRHRDDMTAVGKRLLWDLEFSSVALGSNERTAIFGAAKPNPYTTGGHRDTASRRMISAIGCEDCCGALWQWLGDVAPIGGNGFETVDFADMGQSYGIPYGLFAGAGWASGASCGSRSRDCDYRVSATHDGKSGRGASLVNR